VKRINKDGKKIKLDIKFIHKKDGIKLEEVLREGYLSYLRNLKAKWFVIFKMWCYYKFVRCLSIAVI